MVRISFHGAARQVTGSCYLIEGGSKRLLVDCGLFQGGRDLDEDNADDFGFDPASIDILLLTHAHLDHCGRIPLLVKRGFRGEIIATAATRELARLVLVDAAHLQEEGVRSRMRRHRRQGDAEAQALYTLLDAFRAMDLFGRTASYGTTLSLAPDITATFVDAGHILGSASIRLHVGHGAAMRRIVFSGDLGNSGRPLMNAPSPPGEADYVVIETTYGDRDHRDIAASKAELQQAIVETIDRGGNVVIPAFALERAQELLCCIAESVASGALPRHLPVFLDSPMAIDATDIFRRHPDSLNRAAARRITHGSLVDLPGLRLVRDTAESMAINTLQGGAVIIAGSGMCTGGRIRHHLKHNLWREHASIVFVGFAAKGTLARRIIDGDGSVRLFGQDVRVRAKIWTINGFSAHAGQTALLNWLEQSGKPRQVFLVHGEMDRGMATFADAVEARGMSVCMPQAQDTVDLD